MSTNINEEPQSPQNQKRKWRMSRRGFLIGLGATAGVAALGIGVGLPALRLNIAESLDGAGGPPGSLDAPPTTWFDVLSDNRVRVHVPKVEMGQGIHTALGQIAAEELEVAWEQIEVVQSTTDRGPEDQAGTGASNSVASVFTPLREAAATMREMLRVAAATELGVATADLAVADGVFTVKSDASRQISYGELVAIPREWEVPEEVPALKPVSEYKIIGQPKQRVDFRKKLTGEMVYGYDMRVDGMVYGAVARPPTLGGTLRRAAPGDAPNQPGVVQVVIEDGFAGIVAESRQQAYAALTSLELEWDEGELYQQEELEALVTVGNGRRVVIQKEGDARDLSDSAAVTAEYRTPMAVHAHLEPQAALLDVRDDKVDAWVATQFPFTVRGDIAEALGREESEVNVIATYLGGGFGRKLNVEVAVEAARLSAAVGRPVHVGWNRTEDIRYGYFRPPTHSILRGEVDGNGRIQAIQHEQASGDVAFAFLPGFLSVMFGADFGATRGARLRYGAPSLLTTAYRIDMPIRTGWWRGLGLLANIFAVESFIDEMAVAAGIDPLQFRLNNLPAGETGDRFRTALETVAEMSGWPNASQNGRALGLAIADDVGTVVAQVAEVSVEGDRIRVHKVWSSVDPGLVINPDGAKAQTEGAIIMGLSSVFFEEIVVRDGMVTAANFNLYPLITMKDAPDIEVALINSGEEPFGMGEPPIGPIAAAVGNAVFRLTGQRLRTLPLKI